MRKLANWESWNQHSASHHLSVLKIPTDLRILEYLNGALLGSRLQVHMVGWDRTSEPQQQPWGQVEIWVHNRCNHGARRRPSWYTPSGDQGRHRHHHNQPGKIRHIEIFSKNISILLWTEKGDYSAHVMANSLWGGYNFRTGDKVGPFLTHWSLSGFRTFLNQLYIYQ